MRGCRRHWSQRELVLTIVALSYVDSNGCWIWRGRSIAGNGRPQMDVAGDKLPAARVAYFAFCGRLPKHHACHSCDIGLCINPAHIFDGTPKQNVQDSIHKGRNFNHSKTHCAKGHEYTEANTYRYSGTNGRKCRRCSADHQIELRRQRRVA